MNAFNFIVNDNILSEVGVLHYQNLDNKEERLRNLSLRFLKINAFSPFSFLYDEAYKDTLKYQKKIQFNDEEIVNNIMLVYEKDILIGYAIYNAIEIDHDDSHEINYNIEDIEILKNEENYETYCYLLNAFSSLDGANKFIIMYNGMNTYIPEVLENLGYEYLNGRYEKNIERNLIRERDNIS